MPFSRRSSITTGAALTGLALAQTVEGEDVAPSDALFLPRQKPKPALVMNQHVAPREFAESGTGVT